MRVKGSAAALALAGMVVGAGAVLAAGAGTRLVMNGKVASTDIITQGGKAYVPIRDVAAALDMVVARTADGYELTRAGGANQIEGVNGKVGDDLFNGKYRLKVLKVIRGPKYTRQFAGDKGEIAGYPAGNDVVAVVCRLKNGTHESETVELASGPNTALTDDAEHSYQNVRGLDIDQAERAPKLLPGAATDFALIFYVPSSAALKDLVFSVSDFTLKPGPDFRVSVKE